MGAFWTETRQPWKPPRSAVRFRDSPTLPQRPDLGASAARLDRRRARPAELVPAWANAGHDLRKITEKNKFKLLCSKPTTKIAKLDRARVFFS